MNNIVRLIFNESFAERFVGFVNNAHETLFKKKKKKSETQARTFHQYPNRFLIYLELGVCTILFFFCFVFFLEV